MEREAAQTHADIKKEVARPNRIAMFGIQCYHFFSFPLFRLSMWLLKKLNACTFLELIIRC